MSELYTVLRQTVYLGRKKEDVLPYIPEKFINILYIEPKTEKKKKEISLIENEVFRNIKKLQFESKDLKSLKIAAVCELNRIKQLLSLIKVEFVIDWVENIFFQENPEEKLVIFAYFKETQERLFTELSKKFKNQVLKLTAEMNSKERKKVIEEFQNNPEKKIIVISLLAGKEGINLTSAKTALFIDLD